MNSDGQRPPIIHALGRGRHEKEMGDTWITDMRHYWDDAGKIPDLPGAAGILFYEVVRQRDAEASRAGRQGSQCQDEWLDPHK